MWIWISFRHSYEYSFFFVQVLVNFLCGVNEIIYIASYESFMCVFFMNIMFESIFKIIQYNSNMNFKLKYKSQFYQLIGFYVLIYMFVFNIKIQQYIYIIIFQCSNLNVSIKEQFICVYYTISFFYVKNILPNGDQNYYVITCIFY